MKLGKRPVRHDQRTLHLANYLEAHPPAKPAVDWTKRADKVWGMMQNDQYGDCTCAAAAHAIQTWTANDSGKEITLSDDQVLAAYTAITGFKPGDPATDNGAVELDVLKYWRTTGFDGHKIAAFAALEPHNVEHVKVSIDLFGGCYIGLELPAVAQDQKVWSVPYYGPRGQGAPGSWGGHAVYCVAYDKLGVVCVTWGQLKRMTWSFWTAYCEEAYAILAPDWFGEDFKAPSGFDLSQLQTDLAQVGRLTV
jgi:hypothetical protein